MRLNIRTIQWIANLECWLIQLLMPSRLIMRQHIIRIRIIRARRFRRRCICVFIVVIILFTEYFHIGIVVIAAVDHMRQITILIDTIVYRIVFIVIIGVVII